MGFESLPTPSQKKSSDENPEGISRRDFLKKIAGGALVAAGVASGVRGAFELKSLVEKKQANDDKEAKEQKDLYTEVETTLLGVEDDIKFLEDNFDENYHREESSIDSESYLHRPKITESANDLKIIIAESKERLSVYRQKISDKKLVMDHKHDAIELRENIGYCVSRLKSWQSRDHEADKRAEDWNKKRTNNYAGWRE